MYKQPLTLVKVLVFSLLLIAPVTSCTQEDLLANVIAEAETPEPDPEPDVTPVDNLKINTTPCDYTIENLEAGTTLAVECQLDLKGATITIPSGVTLEYKGGEIINGTLNFASAGKIDGNLLNHKLTVAGNVSLLSETFILHPNRWELVQGVTTTQIAQKNNDNLEELMFYTKSIGATTFSIDKFDAYFEVSKVTSTKTNANFYPTKESVNVPGDFTLLMSDNTVLRVFPNSNSDYALLAAREVSNVTIKGGILIGDRDEHSFPDGGRHEKGHLLYLHAAVDSKVDGVTMKYANGDGMKIDGINFTYNPEYKPTHNILVQNCLFDSNRRNNLSITDGFDITIDNNTFLNAGVDTGKSEGVTPKFAIDIEAARTKDENGDYIYYEKSYDITISNNIERGSAGGGFTVHIGEDVSIENNDVETNISWSFASGVKIINNLVQAKSEEQKFAILGGRSDNSVGSFDNEISGNKIIGYGIGIVIHNRENLVFDNEIENCGVGIYLRNLSNSKVYSNTIYSDENLKSENSRGISAFRANINDVEIYKNIINVKNDPMRLMEVNDTDEGEDYAFNVYDNELNSSVLSTISKSSGINFYENNFNIGTIIYNSSNLDFKDNIITAETTHGFELRDNSNNILFTDNSIDVSAKKECIKSDTSSSFQEKDNSCL
ncbi:NosD domain-containing protein [Cellulophaga fucicola]|uniref:Parallel beta-helix repeat (Two copies) n=1 Tax=Cellulophaga fucicola TaxID=76595 RepID=A0A1K1M0E6_9FLAO|nr:right-handed parallel beta-helix repeat-containing protein [Cellulophaga fucicola]SFW16611.1 parallel beta-helix repeat (two copies) [Cellulophaga fucicola]